MSIRAILRTVMVAIGVAVGLLVWTQWAPDSSRDVAAGAPSAPDIPRDGDREVRSSTRSLDASQHAGGREVMRIAAERHLDFEDGWNIWEGPEVIIMGRAPERDDDDVRVGGDTMRTAGDVGGFTEVRIIGNVRARLPGGGSFTSRRIDYDAVTGIASNCNRNDLEYAGLAVRSDCLEFRTTGDAGGGEDLVAEDLRMWSDLTIAAARGDRGSLPAGLAGRATELRFRPGGEIVTLDGDASLSFADNVMRANLLELSVGSDVRELRGVEARDAARLRMPGEAGGGPRILNGDNLSITLSGESVTGVRAIGTPARLELPGQGTLVAGSIQLSSAAGVLDVRALGDVRWRADQAAGDGPRELTTSDLELRMSGGELERLAAKGDVALESADEGAGSFAGPAVVLSWRDGALSEASWPEGVTLRQPERNLSAGTAKLAAGKWTLGGLPRPAIETDSASLAATSLTLGVDGTVTATGAVEGRLRGDRLAAGAALFGDVPEVAFRAGSAVLGAEGQTILRTGVQVVWESQSLVTEELHLDSAPGRLRALREVQLVASLGGAPAAGAGEPGSEDEPAGTDDDLIAVTSRDLLIEEGSGEIRLAGDATLRQGQRTISADRMAILLDDAGWSQLQAAGKVEFLEPGITGEGDRLEYDFDTRELLLLGSKETPAQFVYGELEYRSAEALRILRQGEDVVIEATEAGRTTTKIVRAATGTIR